jgi:hypothetical protein
MSEGLVPALPTDNFVKLARPKRNIKAKHFKDHITSNIVEKPGAFNEPYSPVLYSF